MRRLYETARERLRHQAPQSGVLAAMTSSAAATSLWNRRLILEPLAECLGPIPKAMCRAYRRLARQLGDHFADQRHPDATATTEQDATVGDDDDTKRIAGQDDPVGDQNEVLADRLRRDHGLNLLAGLQQVRGVCLELLPDCHAGLRHPFSYLKSVAVEIAEHVQSAYSGFRSTISTRYPSGSRTKQIGEPPSRIV